MVYKLFSQRNSTPRTPKAPVYDVLPHAFKVQVVLIMQEALGTPGRVRWSSQRDVSAEAWGEIHRVLKKELGMFALAEDGDDFFAVGNYFMDKSTPAHRALDVIDVVFRAIEVWAAEFRFPAFPGDAGVSCTAQEAVDELNHRFREHNLGFRFEHGQLIKLDAVFTHEMLTAPALALLTDPRFANAEAEFLSAHDHYRHGRLEPALNDALRAFESVMKIICHERKWKYDQQATAAKLIAAVIDNGLVPTFTQEQLTQLRCLLESGTPTARNKTSGHGTGAHAPMITPPLAAFGLHSTAANIVLLVESFNRMKK